MVITFFVPSCIIVVRTFLRNFSVSGLVNAFEYSLYFLLSQSVADNWVDLIQGYGTVFIGVVYLRTITHRWKFVSNKRPKRGSRVSIWL